MIRAALQRVLPGLTYGTVWAIRCRDCGARSVYAGGAWDCKRCGGSLFRPADRFTVWDKLLVYLGVR